MIEAPGKRGLSCVWRWYLDRTNVAPDSPEVGYRRAIQAGEAEVTEERSRWLTAGDFNTMRTMMTGLSGWAKMGKNNNESVRVVDTALTVAATLLVAVSYVLLRG